MDIKDKEPLPPTLVTKVTILSSKSNAELIRCIRELSSFPCTLTLSLSLSNTSSSRGNYASMIKVTLPDNVKVLEMTQSILSNILRKCEYINE